MNAETEDFVAIFGGSFNPPHCSHVMVVSWLLTCSECSKVLIVPCFDHAFAKNLVPFDQRLDMCRLAFDLFGGAVEVLDIEKGLPTPSYTLNTVRRLAEMYPDKRLRLVIGSDIPAETERWKDFGTIERTAAPIIINRMGAPVLSDGPVFPEVSSTAVRERFAAGLNCNGLVPNGVLRYISIRGLYAKTSV